MYARIVRYCEHVFLNKTHGCCNNPVKPTNWNASDLYVQHTSINFTKRNVPFTNKLLIKPLYDNHAKLTYLMGITYNDMPPTHVTIFSTALNKIIDEIEGLPFAISLTTPTPPFNVLYVNTQWVSLCGYSLQDMVGNTFSKIQGYSVANLADATVFKYKILKTMISIICSLFSKNIRL
jgi:hypothetical protein